MTNGQSFWDINIWVFVLVLAAIFAAMLIANLLIKSIKPLRKALIPAPVLGGFILLGFYYIYKAIVGFDHTSVASIQSILEVLTYHCLGLGFVASALKRTKKLQEKKNSAQKGIFNASLITIGGYLIQAIVGIGVSLVCFLIIGSWPGSGLLLPMGYGQGPGQAFNWGSIFENSVEGTYVGGQFQYGTSFGLSIAALGFISASIGGVIFLNIQRRKGNLKMVQATETKEPTLDTFTEENEIPASESIDKSSVQVGLVLVGYAISFLTIFGLSKACDAAGGFFVGTVKPLIWGFNFIFGTLIATLIKILLNALKKKGVIKREYLNNYMMDRISGIAFDVMVVAAIAAIDLSAFTHLQFLLPLLLMGILGACGTYFYCRFVCNRLYPEYREEMFLAMYGMLTGTASTGVILLREIDPEFKTPACNNMVFQALYALLLGFPVLLAVGAMPKSWTNMIIWGAIILVYAVFIVVLTFRESIFKKKNKGDAPQNSAEPQIEESAE